MLLFSNADKNLSEPNTRICPTRITEFVRPKKIGYGQEFFVRILNLDMKFFAFLLFEPAIDPNLVWSEIVRPEKSGIGH